MGFYNFYISANKNGFLDNTLMISKRKPLEGLMEHQVPALSPGMEDEDDEIEKPEPIIEQARQTRLF